MITKLSKHGNGFAIILEQPINELLAINEHSYVKLHVQGSKLIIEPIRDTEMPGVSDDTSLEAILEEINAKYSEDLKKLADS